MHALIGLRPLRFDLPLVAAVSIPDLTVSVDANPDDIKSDATNKLVVHADLVLNCTSVAKCFSSHDCRTWTRCMCFGVQANDGPSLPIESDTPPVTETEKIGKEKGKSRKSVKSSAQAPHVSTSGGDSSGARGSSGVGGSGSGGGAPQGDTHANPAR